MDPRVKLYADIVLFRQIQRYEFSSWTPIETKFCLLRSRLHSIIDSLPDLSNIPSIRRQKNRCFRCAKGTKDHSCPQVPCKSCGYFHDELVCCCRFSCASCCTSKIKAFDETYTRMCTNEQISRIRCFKCRKIGHICQ